MFKGSHKFSEAQVLALDLQILRARKFFEGVNKEMSFVNIYIHF